MDKHEYSNGDITIVWQPELCIHSGICVKMLPEVYKPKERPWIKIENAATAALQAQVEQCPSGALSYRLKEAEAQPVSHIVRTDDGTKAKFEIFYKDEPAGFMSYVWAGEKKLIIDHTEVGEMYNGLGLGKALVFAAVQFARANQKQIKPLCPFAAAMFKRYSEINDVLV